MSGPIVFVRDSQDQPGFVAIELIMAFEVLGCYLSRLTKLRLITVVRLELVDNDRHYDYTSAEEVMRPLIRLVYFYYWSTARQELLHVFANMARFKEGVPPALDGECHRYAQNDPDHDNRPLLTAICFACGLRSEAEVHVVRRLANHEPATALEIALDAARAYLGQGNHPFSHELWSRMETAART